MNHPVSDADAWWLATAFPCLFVAGWLAVTTLLGAMSGWFALQAVYSRGEDPALLTLRGKSGGMGLGVGMNGILTLSACESGLRVGVWRMFGLFQRPFLVPWPDIRTEATRRLFVPSTRLRFGMPQIGTLTIDTASWQRLAAFAKGRGAAALVLAPVSRRQTGRALLLQWAVVSGAAGTFYLLASRGMQAQGPTVPVAVCYGFPAVAIGIPQLIRLWRFGR